MFEFHRAAHRHMAVALLPGDVERAARQADRRRAGEQPEPDAGDQRRAGGRAAGEGSPGAPLPHVERDVIGRIRAGKGDIGAVRQHGVVLQGRPEMVDVGQGRLGRQPEDEVRVAHAHRRGVAERRHPGRVRHQREGARVGNGVAQRDVVPAEPGRPHVDGEAPGAVAPAIQHAAIRLEGRGGAIRPVQQEPGDAARAVAAGARARPVGVEDVDKGFGARAPWCADRHELVEGEALAAREQPGVGAVSGRPPPRWSTTRMALPDAVHLGVATWPVVAGCGQGAHRRFYRGMASFWPQAVRRARGAGRGGQSWI